MEEGREKRTTNGCSANNQSSCSSSRSDSSSNSDILINSTEGDNFFLDYSKSSAADGGNRHQKAQAASTITPTTTTTTRPNNVAFALAQSQMAKKILLRYSQRWISQYDKRKLMFADDNLEPRHLSTGKCLCQFIEEQLNRVDNNDTETKVKTSKQSSLRERRANELDTRSASFDATSSSSSSSSSSIDHDQSQNGSSEMDQNIDMSLEFGGDSIGRSDDLIKRLRLLLELRKDDLQGIGSSLFADIHSKTPQFLSTFNDNAETPNTHSTGYTTADSLTIDSTSHKPSSPRTPTPPNKPSSGKGKKIFGPRDGLFLQGVFGAKKNHHHQHQQHQPRDQIIEIC